MTLVWMKCLYTSQRIECFDAWLLYVESNTMMTITGMGGKFCHI